MSRSLAAWVAGHLKEGREDEGILSITVVDETLIVVDRRNKSPVQVACVSFDPLDAFHLRSVISRFPEVEFVLNLPRGARSAGAAYVFAAEHGIAFGGMGDAREALRQDNLGQYLHRETRYIERILRQHSRVSSFERLDDSRYRLDRNDLSSIVVYTENEYEVTAESVRLAIDRYGEFDAFVTTNPSAVEISPQAVTAAQDSGRRIFLWREFMAAIHKPWD